MSTTTKCLAHTFGPSATRTSTTKQTAQALLLLLAVITLGTNLKRAYLATSCSRRAFWRTSSTEVPHHQVWQTRTNPKTPAVKDAALLKPQTQFVFFWDFLPFSGTYWDQLGQRNDQDLAVPPCAEDLSDGEILTGFYWSTHFAQQQEPATAQWSSNFTAAINDKYPAHSSGFPSHKDVLSPCLPLSPVSSIRTASHSPLPVSTGLSQPFVRAAHTTGITAKRGVNPAPGANAYQTSAFLSLRSRGRRVGTYPNICLGLIPARYTTEPHSTG